jgi:2-polyprenyl-6-methoxyphenol hydroxylase-like FAD-dependent oxidoreductase
VDADLVVATDGVASRLRAARAPAFRPTVTTGRNRYIWLGTSKVLDAFTFAFERTVAGWVWAYG